nr:esterase-like activity of phytase family protein [uncultured Roseateles sp.]
MNHNNSVNGRLGLALLAGLMIAAFGESQAASLNYLGQQALATGTQFAGTQVGGLSGIDYNARTGGYFAISDDRSQFNAARFYGLDLDLGKFQRSNTPGSAGVNFKQVTTLLTADGSAFGALKVDPESIRLLPGASGPTLLWTNEGQRTAAGFQSPTLRQAALDGSHLRDFQIPTAYLPSGSNSGEIAGDRGIRNNLAFESLTVSKDGKTAWVATENALTQDGPAAAVGVASPSRVAQFNLTSGLREREYVYLTDAVTDAPNPTGSFATNGLVELLAVDDSHFLALERSFSTGVGNSIRIYLTSTTGASEVSGLAALQGQSYQAMSKQLLLDLGQVKNDDGTALLLDNVEGITFGPVVNGKQTLVLVADNNFAASQQTQFIAFSVDGALAPVPEPTSWALMLSGLLALGAVARKQRK